jgi:ParB family chromosome partitioning protein
MAGRLRKASPILDAAGTAIGSASQALVSATSEFNHSFELQMDTVQPDPDQPRTVFDDEALTALANTLRAEGQLQPILVRRDSNHTGRWIIVAGERRWRAAQLLGWPNILAMPFSGDAEVATLLENLQRVDLSPIEEAKGLRRLIDGKGWTQDQAAKTLGKPKSDISGTLRILHLPDDVLSAVLTSEPPLGKNVLIELSRVEDTAEVARLVALANRGELTVKAIRATRDAVPRGAKLRNGARSSKRDTSAPIDRATRLLGHLALDEGPINNEDIEALKTLRSLIDGLLARAR